MKVSFPSKTNNSGKYKFLRRLKNSFSRRSDVEISDNSDINVYLTPNQRKKGSKNILRVDGIWFDKGRNWKQQNKSQIEQLRKADGIVYQNKFCKKAADKYLGEFDGPVACISNGANPDEFSHGKHVGRPFFLALCNWRPHKRLKDTVDGFLRSGMMNTHDLWVFGNPDYVVKHKSVKYKKGDQKVLSESLSKCVATVHLAWIDWCPNSVVESISARKPVIHTPGGGTELLVKNDGPKISDKKWNFEPIHLYKPPSLDLDEVGQAYKVSESFSVGDRTDLHIDTVADQYIDFFNQVLA